MSEGLASQVRETFNLAMAPSSTLIVPALLLLLCVVAGIAFCQDISSKLIACLGTDGPTVDKSPLILNGDQDADSEYYELPDDQQEQQPEPASQYCLGIMFALIVGLAGGSILVPSTYVADRTSESLGRP